MENEQSNIPNEGGVSKKNRYIFGHIGGGNDKCEKKKMRKQNDPQNLKRPQIVFQSGKIKKWSNRPVSNWATVRNQLALDDKIQARILKYEND